MKIGNLVYNKLYGIGKIIYIDDNVFNLYGVEFENYNSELNDLGGRCENGYGYWCRPFDIIPYKFTKKDLKLGDKLTTRGGAELIYSIKNCNRSFIGINNIKQMSLQFLSGLNNDLTTTNRVCSIDDIVKVERPTYKTIFERKEEILDEKEKEYLVGVIRPFKDRVKYIIKVWDGCDKEFISIVLSKNDRLLFPYFKIGTMYKGMEVDKKYTLKELGLDE